MRKQIWAQICAYNLLSRNLPLTEDVLSVMNNTQEGSSNNESCRDLTKKLESCQISLESTDAPFLFSTRAASLEVS